jgi:kynureninase
MADGRGVVVDVRADDRMRAASTPFAMGRFASISKRTSEIQAGPAT